MNTELTQELRRLRRSILAQDASASMRRAHEHARWFVSLRWIAVVVSGTLASLSVHVLHVLPEQVWIPLILVVAALALLNVLYLQLLSLGVNPHSVTLLQAYGDLVLLMLLLHFSGGIENPLVLLMIFHVIISGITVTRGQCYTVAVVASVLFGLLATLEAAHLIPHYTLQIVPHYGEHGDLAHAAHDPLYATSFSLILSSILLLTAFFVTTLADRLRDKEHELSDLADRALTQSQLLEQALETTGTGLAVFDPSRNPVLTNGRWVSWFGPADAGSVDLAEHSGVASQLSATIADGRVRVVDLDHADEDGGIGKTRQRAFQITTAPLKDAGGQITNVVQLARDVSEQKVAQRKMLRAGQLAAVGELAGQVAHEVNNPISIISAKSRLLLSDHRDEFSPRTAEELEKVIVLADRVAEIASGLLSYCRPSSAQKEPIDIGVPLRRALSMVQQRLEDAGVIIRDETPDRLPRVVANENEIEQVFLNLFLNALDALSEGGSLSIETEDTTRQSGRVLEVRVVDTGVGMSESTLARVFEPFFTTKPESKGTGLGLSICLGLVQSYGGSIEVQSEEGRGTCVEVYFPVHESWGTD